MRLSRIVSSMLLLALSLLLGGNPNAQEATGNQDDEQAEGQGGGQAAEDHSARSEVEERTPRALAGEEDRTVGTTGPSRPEDVETENPGLGVMDAYARGMERRAREIEGRDRAGVEVAQ